MFFRPKIKILGIDDADLHHHLMEVIFNGPFSQFEYTGIPGIEAFNGVKASDYDIIILDVKFRKSDFNGEDIETHLRKEKGYDGEILYMTCCSEAFKSLQEKGKLAIQKVPHPDMFTTLCQQIATDSSPQHVQPILEDISDYRKARYGISG